jgi:hypothetical protein
MYLARVPMRSHLSRRCHARACRLRFAAIRASCRPCAKARADKPSSTKSPPDRPLGQPAGGENGPVRLCRRIPARQISHTRSPASTNPPSSMDQSPALNSRKRRSAAISIFVNMICSASVNVWCRWIGIDVTPVIFLPQPRDRGCDPNATAANFVRRLIRIDARFAARRPKVDFEPLSSAAEQLLAHPRQNPPNCSGTINALGSCADLKNVLPQNACTRRP